MPQLTDKRGIKAFLRTNIGVIVSTEAIREASGNQVQYSRRLRELRDEEGWPIESHLDADDLRPGEYRLSAEPPESRPLTFKRGVSARLRAQVLDRNGNTCQMCGVAANDTDANGRRAVLHVGHIKPKTEGGKDELNNLRALCSVCNQGAKNIVTVPPDRLWLLSQVRRANTADQLEVLEWLRKKYGKD